MTSDQGEVRAEVMVSRCRGHGLVFRTDWVVILVVQLCLVGCSADYFWDGTEWVWKVRDLWAVKSIQLSINAVLPGSHLTQVRSFAKSIQTHLFWTSRIAGHLEFVLI